MGKGLLPGGGAASQGPGVIPVHGLSFLCGLARLPEDGQQELCASAAALEPPTLLSGSHHARVPSSHNSDNCTQAGPGSRLSEHPSLP